MAASDKALNMLDPSFKELNRLTEIEKLTAEKDNIGKDIKEIETELDSTRESICAYLKQLEADTITMVNDMAACTRLGSVREFQVLKPTRFRINSCYDFFTDATVSFETGPELSRRSLDYTVTAEYREDGSRVVSDKMDAMPSVPGARDTVEFELQKHFLEDVILLNNIILTQNLRSVLLSQAESAYYRSLQQRGSDLRQQLTKAREAEYELEAKLQELKLNLRTNAFFYFDEQVSGRGDRKYTDTKIIYITKLTNKTMWYRTVLKDTNGIAPVLGWEFSKRINKELLRAIDGTENLPEVK